MEHTVLRCDRSWWVCTHIQEQVNLKFVFEKWNIDNVPKGDSSSKIKITHNFHSPFSPSYTKGMKSTPCWYNKSLWWPQTQTNKQTNKQTTEEKHDMPPYCSFGVIQVSERIDCPIWLEREKSTQFLAIISFKSAGSLFQRAGPQLLKATSQTWIWFWVQLEDLHLMTCQCLAVCLTQILNYIKC